MTDIPEPADPISRLRFAIETRDAGFLFEPSYEDVKALLATHDEVLARLRNFISSIEYHRPEIKLPDALKEAVERAGAPLPLRPPQRK